MAYLPGDCLPRIIKLEPNIEVHYEGGHCLPILVLSKFVELALTFLKLPSGRVELELVLAELKLVLLVQVEPELVLSEHMEPRLVPSEKVELMLVLSEHVEPGLVPSEQVELILVLSKFVEFALMR